MTPQELHQIAMNHVGKILEKKGFEFIAINSQLKKHPQFICVDKKNILHFVLVKHALYPDNPNDFDIIWMETFKSHAMKKNAKVKFAGVGIAHANDLEKPVTKHEDYAIYFEDFEDIL